MSAKISLVELRRILEQGIAQTCKDAGYQHFALRVCIYEPAERPAIIVEVVPMSLEDAARLAAEALAEQAAADKGTN